MPPQDTKSLPDTGKKDKRPPSPDPKPMPHKKPAGAPVTKVVSIGVANPERRCVPCNRHYPPYSITECESCGKSGCYGPDTRKCIRQVHMTQDDARENRVRVSGQQLFEVEGVSDFCIWLCAECDIRLGHVRTRSPSPGGSRRPPDVLGGRAHTHVPPAHKGRSSRGP